MKKHSFLPIYVVLLALVSCQSRDALSVYRDEPATFLTKSNNPGCVPSKYAVSLSDAIHFSELYHPGRDFTITPYVVKEDTLLYALNYDGGGWLVISGDKRFDPNAAECPDGRIDFDAEDGYLFWFKSLAEDICSLREKNPDLENDNTALWQAISPIKKEGITKMRNTPKWVIRNVVSNITSTWSYPVPHLMVTKWGQGFPWNNKLPIDNNPNGDGSKCVTGCVSVAVAQLLYYLHYKIGKPTALYHTVYCLYPGVISPASVSALGFVREDKVTNSSRWNNMALTSSSSGSTVYVGDLMLDIGTRFNTSYACAALGGSGAQLSDCTSVLDTYYGIDCYNSSHSLINVKTSLDTEKPVLISRDAVNASNQIVSSHAWVIDGYAKEIREQTMTRYCEYTGDWTYGDEVYDTFAEVQQVYGFVDDGDSQEYPGPTITNYYYQMNWGFDGIGDTAYYNSNGTWTVNGVSYNSTDPNRFKIYYSFY